VARSTRDFASSEAKDCIRRTWDRPVLEARVKTIGHPLAYFGLPGPAIHDLIDWGDLLARRTGVERLRRGGFRTEDLERHRRLLRTVMTSGLSDGFQLLRGEIEDVILDATDSDGTPPSENDGAPAIRMKFRYDVVNLDFVGGVGHPDHTGQSKRTRAIKELFRRQEGTGFVLLLTVSVRDQIEPELSRFLREVQARVDKATSSDLEWAASGEKGRQSYMLKAALPLFIQHTAEEHMFRCHAYPPVVYRGTGPTRLVHFVFDFDHTTGNFQAVSSQSIRDLVRLQMLEPDPPKFVVSSVQAPGFDEAACLPPLEYLKRPEEQPLGNEGG
jgi:hypothetical protein